MPRFLEAILQFIETTPADVLGAYILMFIFPVVLFSVIIWGLLQLWLDRRQGQFAGRIRWHLLHVNVPGDAIQTPKGLENFFRTLGGAKSSVTWKEKWFDGKFQSYYSFEMVSVGGRISFYIRCQAKTRNLVEAALYAQYPEAQITEVEDYVGVIPKEFPNDTWDLWGSEVRMKKDNYFPIITWPEFEHQGEKDQKLKDPLLTLIEFMGSLKEGENLMIQMMVMPPAEQDWVKKGEQFIEKVFGKDVPDKKGSAWSDFGKWWVEETLSQTVGYAPGSGGSEEKKRDDFVALKLTPKEKKQVEAVNDKISKYGFITKIRFIYFGKHEVFNKSSISAMMKGLYNQYGHQYLNGLGFWAKATVQDDYPWLVWQMPARQRMLAARYGRRSLAGGSTPFIMNVEELATMWHFPAADARTPVLTTIGSRRSEAPSELVYGDSENVLPNFAGPQGNTDGRTESLPSPKPLATPQLGQRPSMPSMPPAMDTDIQEVVKSQQPTADEMPRVGMPAPLPPGLDIEAIESGHEPPNNLPT